MKKLIIITTLILSNSICASTTYFSNGSTAQTYGNQTYYSDGSISQTFGNTTYFSDGSYAQRY